MLIIKTALQNTRNILKMRSQVWGRMTECTKESEVEEQTGTENKPTDDHDDSSLTQGKGRISSKALDDMVDEG